MKKKMIGIKFDDKFLYIQGKKIKLSPESKKQFRALFEKYHQDATNLVLYGAISHE